MTKHVFMIWLVAALLFVTVTWIVRRYLRQEQEQPVPRGAMNALEAIVEFVRDSISLPNVGSKWVRTWTPLLLTLFFFILAANMVGLIPAFDVLALLNHTVLHLPPDSFLTQVTHGGSTATGNFNVTAGLATITFFAIIIAGTAHGFVQHWKNLAPHGLPTPVYFLLIPMEIIGMLVRPFALTMRLAANMTGGHIAILAILSFVFIFTELFASSMAGIGVGLGFSLPLAVAISASKSSSSRAGVRVHTVVRGVHRHGDSRAPLSHSDEEKRMENQSRSWAPCSAWASPSSAPALGIGRLAPGRLRAWHGSRARRRRSPLQPTCPCSCSKASRPPARSSGSSSCR